MRAYISIIIIEGNDYMKLIPIGIENFKETIDKYYYYIDKTNLIIDILNEQVVFCTRS